MRTITIIGAGQSGLQLGLGLLKQGYHVSLITDKTPEALTAGPVLSGQCMFHTALEAERKIIDDQWADTAPEIKGISFVITSPQEMGNKMIQWQAPLNKPAQSIDQRLKFSNWMDRFVDLGGCLLFDAVTPEALPTITEASDLVIIATGKHTLSTLFERDEKRSPFSEPQRHLAVFSIQHSDPKNALDQVAFNVIPGVGEYFVVPCMTAKGPGETLVFEAVPGGDMDSFHGYDSCEALFTHAKQLLKSFLPWEYERIKSAALTDQKAANTGKLTPVVKKPIAVLSSGKPVFGMADAVNLNDPIMGQGSNNAAKAADIYLSKILEHTNQPFTTEWMEDTFNAYWDQAEWVFEWNNMMLGEPPEHVMSMLAEAQSNPALAAHIVNGFDDPHAVKTLFTQGH